jgi:hypothetical protein
VTDGLVARDSVQVRHVANSTEAVARKFRWRPLAGSSRCLRARTPSPRSAIGQRKPPTCGPVRRAG